MAALAQCDNGRGSALKRADEIASSCCRPGRATSLRGSERCRGTIEWSDQLLGHRKRVLLRRVSVFAGG
jgi:hypothetical protein